MARVRRGLTLMEVMLSVGIVVVMATIGWATVEDAFELNDALATNDNTMRSARVALDRLRRELQLAYLTRHRPGFQGDAAALQQQQRQGVAPVGGAAQQPEIITEPTYVTVFVGVDQDPDELWFATLGHQRLYKNSRECEQAEVTVWSERADRDQGFGNVIYHRESQRVDGEPDEGGRIWPLAYNVRTFNLRYLDGTTNEWFDEWDTRSAETPYRLPRAVQIGLVMMAPDPSDEDRTVDMPFFTTVPLMYADPVVPRFGQQLTGAAGGAAGDNPLGLPSAGDNWGF
jgi:general secretion pathway protein J